MNQFKVALVNPPPFQILERQYDTPRFGRMGLAYLAGYLRHHKSCDVEIIDAKLERLSFDETVRRVVATRPNLVGLGAFTCEVKPAAHIARLVKQALPAVTTAIGGVHVTALPEQTLREFPQFDLGVCGEGEATFAELCEALQNDVSPIGLRGVSLRTEDGVIVGPPRDRIGDQDSIPFPAWDLLPRADEYILMTQRGCPFNCLFCMNPNGRVARARSVENFMEELRWVLDAFQPTDLRFGDELFSVNMDRTHELLDAMLEAGVSKRVKWTAQTHVHFVDAPLLKKMKAAGAWRLGMGIETGDAEVLKHTGKGSTPEMILKAAAAAREAGLPIETYFIMGHPNESLDSMKRTVDLAVRMNPHTPIFGIMVPFPGTEVGRLAAAGEAGYRLKSTNWDDYDKQIGGALEFANLSRHAIERLQIWAYIKVFLWNQRYRDLVRFCWQYRREGFVVLRKVLLRRSEKLSGGSRLGADAGGASPGPDRSEIVTATREWQDWQKTDLARMKKQHPGQSKVVFIELQKKRPQPSPAGH
jgi:radical SAM superfamily enzyme YgiQ (UPF0313 family)